MQLQHTQPKEVSSSLLLKPRSVIHGDSEFICLGESIQEYFPLKDEKSYAFEKGQKVWASSRSSVVKPGTRGEIVEFRFVETNTQHAIGVMFEGFSCVAVFMKWDEIAVSPEFASNELH